MNQEQYVQLVAQGYNRIPIIREVLADTETPLSVYLKLAKEKTVISLSLCREVKNGDATP